MERISNISQLIFVIGFPRSGTSWLSSLINSHRDTVYRHEFFGRHHRSFGDALFRKLRFDDGLSDEDYASAIGILLKGEVDSDKPPFFRKRFGLVTNSTVRKLVWLMAKARPLLAPVYTHLCMPRAGNSVALVIKETRSSVNLHSIIRGVRTDKLIVLVRHPYGVIASHVRGNKAGVMSESSSGGRRDWLRFHADARYVRDNRITEDYILKIPEVEFLAISWRVQNDDYLRIHEAHRCSRVIVYEAFLNETLHNAIELLEFLGLQADDQVIEFVRDSSRPRRNASVLAKDASCDYYSVYRGKDFDADRWRKSLSPEDLALIDRHTRSLVYSLGLDKWIEPRDGRTKVPAGLAERSQQVS